MRRLSDWLRRPRRERGVSALLFALLGICLIGATGLGIDTTNLVMQRSRAQHGADAAAFAVAYDCVAKNAKCADVPAAQTAADLAKPNLRSSSTDVSGLSAFIPGGVGPSSTQVSVEVSRNVDNSFISVFPGLESSTVTARATAQWKKHVTGAKVIPFAISLCAYVNAHGKTTPQFLSSNQNDVLTKFKKKDTAQWLDDNLTMQGCEAPAGLGGDIGQGHYRTIEGGLWFAFGSNGTVCSNSTDPLTKVKVFDHPENIVGKNEQCTATRYGGLIGPKDNVLLLAIYTPATNRNWGGLLTINNDTTKDAKPAGNDPAFRVQLVGFAPFRVTGWCIGDTKTCDPAKATNGQIGLLGNFIDSAKEFPADYGTEGAHFGAVKVELIN